MLSAIYKPYARLFMNKKTISLWIYNFILAIWLGIFLNFTFYKTVYFLSPYGLLNNGIFTLSTICIVVLAFNVVLQLFNWSWTTKILTSILIVIGGFSAYFVNSLGVLITADQIQNILQTDVREVQDLWSLRLVLWSIIMVIIPLILWFSKQWQAQHQAQVDCLQSKESHKLSHDHLFPSLLSLLDIKTQVIDPKNDMLNTCRSSSQPRASL